MQPSFNLYTQYKFKYVRYKFIELINIKYIINIVR